MSIKLTKKQLEDLYFTSCYRNREIDIDGNEAKVTYVIKYNNKYYAFIIYVHVNYLDDDWYIYKYCVNEEDNELDEVKPVEITTIKWEYV